MIVAFEDLPRYRHEVAMVDGAFDPLHPGHIAYFREASRLGAPLLANIAPDDYVRRKHPPFLPAARRAEIIDAIRYIAYPHVNRFDTEAVLEHLQPRYYVKGRDWEGRLPARQLEICARHGIAIVYTDSVVDSSTRILEAWVRARGAPR